LANGLVLFLEELDEKRKVAAAEVEDQFLQELEVLHSVDDSGPLVLLDCSRALTAYPQRLEILALAEELANVSLCLLLLLPHLQHHLSHFF
jgi:hypothetical protein